jgi:hypothetical protein
MPVTLQHRGSLLSTSLSLHSWYIFRALFLVFGLWIMILLETIMMISNMVMLMGASTLLVGLVVNLAMT